MLEELGDVANSRGDQGNPERCGLERREGQALYFRRQADDVAFAIERADVAPVAGEVDDARELERGGQLRQSLALGSVADQESAKVRPGSTEPGEGSSR